VPKVLYVSHNHPSNRPGGVEVYAAELYRAAKGSDSLEPLFVAKHGPPFSDDAPNEDSRFSLVDGDRDEYFIHTDAAEFSRLFGTMRRKRVYTEDWPAFLEVHRPQLVHFQHTLYLGYDIIRATRAVLPDAPLVYTLHEFLPICHHNGQMVRTESLSLCDRASPWRCHQCFPQIPSQTFFLRQTFIKSAMEPIDLFITPSQHARQRYIEWGIPAEKIIHEDYGRIPVTPLDDPPNAGQRRRIAFFGQITPFKGVDILLEAVKLLQARGVGCELTIHGANLEFQRRDFREHVEELLLQTADGVRFAGRYEQRELPALMSAVDWVVVPSIWWETGPLVIHEALMHHRPVICSDIGAMPERITDGVNGLHFRTADHHSLADTIQRAVENPRLWQTLRASITHPYPMAEHLKVISARYDDLLAAAEPPVAM
jgi:glycosyltransferase involved in cell wall biosynthesis